MIISMKQVLYMDGPPIQHSGENGRELPQKISELYFELDAECLFESAEKVEGFINNIYRMSCVPAE